MKKQSNFKTGMIFIAIASTLCTVILFILHGICDVGLVKTFAITTLTIAFHFDSRLLIGNIMPLFKHKINPNAPYFQLKKGEEKIYKKLNVKSWKSKVPTYDPDEFDIKKHSVDEIIINTCNSEIIHTLNIFISYIPVLFSIWFDSLPVFIITSVLASIYDLQFVILQRYNRPRLIKIAHKKERKL